MPPSANVWTTMNDKWDEIGYVISSDYRVAVLRRLADGPATPSRLAEDTGIGIAHVSRALQGLREHSLVTLLVPESRKKGRLYGITEKGKTLWGQMQSENLVDTEQ